MWMPTDHILALLIAERDKLNAAIAALQGSELKRRGRPPKNAAAAPATGAAEPVQRKRAKRTAAQKKAQAARMKAYWAAKKKAEK
jgi:hypothetical protein